MKDAVRPPAQSGTLASGPTAAERRRWERVSLEGKRAYAVIGVGPNESLKVIDMSQGGVALEVRESLALSDSFHAVLRVPILGEVRVKLKKLYTQRVPGQQARVGCLYVT